MSKGAPLAICWDNWAVLPKLDTTSIPVAAVNRLPNSEKASVRFAAAATVTAGGARLEEAGLPHADNDMTAGKKSQKRATCV
jgi:hypothetical protein